jgi:hypothetical protein
VNINKITHYPLLLALEIEPLMAQLSRVNFEAYWRFLVKNQHSKRFALFVAWDTKGVHALVHAQAPGTIRPGEGEICFAVTDATLSRAQAREVLETAEDWLREQGAVRWGMTTERNWKAFERLYGPFEHSHRLVKQL